VKLSLLLHLLGLKLRVSALLSAAFRKRLRTEDFEIVVRTAQGGPARTFRIRGGRVRSRRGRGRSPDTELVWCDPQTAVRIMLSSEELDSFSAIGTGQLRVVGNLENALRFMELAK
jgi:hypothetical protein